MIWIGVDLGNQGAVAFLDDNCKILRLEDMPTRKDTRSKTKVDAKSLYSILSWVSPVSLLALEWCQPYTKAARSSVFAFGNNVGRTQSVIELLSIPYIEPTPQMWKKAILAGTDKSKEAALRYCEARWPGVCEGLDGRADALCLAAFALQTSTGTAQGRTR